MKLSVRLKLLWIISPLLLALLYFAGQDILHINTARVSAEKIYNLVELSAYNSRLVHELQKERGMSAGYLGSKGKKFADSLPAQRLETDKRLNDLNSYLKEAGSNIKESSEVWSVVESANTMLNQLSSMRQGITGQTTPVGQALSYYTTINGKLLSVPGLAVNSSQVAQVSYSLAAYYEFLQGKERAGIERAVLSNTFGSAKFGSGMYKRFIQLVTEQNSYFATFQVYSNSQGVKAYQQFLSSPAVKEVESYRSKAFAGELKQDAVAWFTASTKRINLLKEQEEQLTERLLALSSNIVSTNQHSFWFHLVGVILLVAVSGYFSFILIKGLTRQVGYLNNTMKTAAGMDLSYRCQAIGSDELTSIAIHLNKMLDAITDTVHIITDSSGQLAAVSDQSMQAVQKNSDLLQKEQTQVLMVASAIEQMSQSIQQVASNIRSTSEQANIANKLVSDSNQVVNQSTQSIMDVSSRVDSVSETINLLHQSSGDITNVVDVIQGIAEQTNLLALNAAIEAARAGEFGRGFAVVADEVRSLAQRTQESTLEIESMVKLLQENSDSAYERMGEVKNLVDSSVDKSAQVQAALEEIVGAIDGIKVMANQINSEAEQQVTVSNDISSSIQGISSNIQVSADSGEQISSSAREQASLAEKLKELANQFKIK